MYSESRKKPNKDTNPPINDDNQLRRERPAEGRAAAPERRTANRFVRAEFLCSAPTLDHAPPDQGWEVAFAGRSNAGKSSAINAITGLKGIARTSKTPGRTQHLVFFVLDDGRRLVDLPGYGYAKVPDTMKRRWQQSMDTYLRNRRSLRGLVLIMDVRRPLMAFDHAMLGWCRAAGMPVHVLLSKADKLKRGAGLNELYRVRKGLESVYPDATAELFSATRRVGVETARRRLEAWLEW